jgi:hypothetical protein
MSNSGLMPLPARGNGRFRRFGASMLLASAGFMGLSVEAASAGGPFAGMGGAWSGVGTVSMKTGTKERIRCTAQYVVKNDDNNFQQALRCQSASYKFEVNAYVDHDGGSLSGYWTELVNNVKGGVSGKASGNRVNALLSGTGFSATLDLLTKGTSQQVVIEPGADTSTQVQQVSITLRKAG